jgi:hypothetical protein
MLEWCRNQPCACQPCGARSEAHHSTTDDTRGPRRGKGQKSSDDSCLPLCAKHHHQFHNLTGYFESFTKPLIRSWQANQVKVHRDRYEAEFGEQPKQRVKPSKILPRLPVVSSGPPADPVDELRSRLAEVERRLSALEGT